MATDPVAPPPLPAVFPAAKIPLLLRALADPEGEGRGTASADGAASIKQIETNLALYHDGN